MENNLDYNAISRHLVMFKDFWKDGSTNEYFSIPRLFKLLMIIWVLYWGCVVLGIDKKEITIEIGKKAEVAQVENLNNT